MQDMKMSAAEQKKEMPAEMQKQEYPYGLRIRLGKDELTKLGVKKLPGVGDEFQIGAVGHVVSVSANESEGGGDYASCEIQITHMELDGDEEATEDKLYKKK